MYHWPSRGTAFHEFMVNKQSSDSSTNKINELFGSATLTLCVEVTLIYRAVILKQ